jgi:DNA-binding NarL/FixJ family response regulator
MVVGDTCVTEAGMAAIIGRDKRYQICASAHTFHDAGEMVRRYRPDILLIEPFLEDRDGIRWIKDLAKENPDARILIVSRQPERVYAERALHAGATGYCMNNGSLEDLMCALETVAAGKIFTSPAITALAVERFAQRESAPQALAALSDRELAVFCSLAIGRGPGEISTGLGVSRKTIETHCEHIKQKLGYANAEELRRGARELLGAGEWDTWRAGTESER